MSNKIQKAYSHPPSTIGEPVTKGNYVEVVDILKESCQRLSEHRKTIQKDNPNNNNDGRNKDLEKSENSNFSNFEEILEALGGFGNYQLFILILLLILEIPTAFVTFIPIFVGRVPQTWMCGNISMPLTEICGSCKHPPAPLLQNVEESIVAQWGLICEKEWVFDFITSIQMLGMFFGSVVGSQFADWYGRRYGFLGATLLLLAGSLISAFAGNPYIYAIARFLCGAGVTSFMNVTLVAVVEVMPPKWRSLSNCVGPTGEGIMVLSVLAYFLQSSWRTLYFATLAPFALIVIIYPLVPESPRWLMKQGRIEEAAKILHQMARMNRNSRVKISTSILRKIVEKERVESDSDDDATTKRWTYLDFIKDPKLRTTSFYNMAVWFTWSLTFYGISFNIKNVRGDIYTNVFLMGAANAVGQRFALLLNNNLGRRKTLFASMTFSAVVFVALAVIMVVMDDSNNSHLVILSLCLIGQFGMACARSALRLISGESFPTSVRAMGMGIGGITANIAGILTPQLAYLGTTWPSLPFFTFAFVSVGGSLIAFLMAETMGRPLDDSSSSTASSTDDNDKDKDKDKDIGVKPSLHDIFINNKNSKVILVSISRLVDQNEPPTNTNVSEKLSSNTGMQNPCYVPDPSSFSNDPKRSPVGNTRTC